MPRLTKNPEERKKEFIDTARKLFKEKGFEYTSVDDIVDTMGVAKGLYYYYFKTKDDILYEIVENMLASLRGDIETAIIQDRGSPIHNFGALFVPSIQFAENSFELLDYFKEKRGREFFNYYQREARAMTKPILMAIMDQGVKASVFDIEYPSETADMLMNIQAPLYPTKTEKCTDEEYMIKLYICERLLGVKAGKLREELNPTAI